MRNQHNLLLNVELLVNIIIINLIDPIVNNIGIGSNTLKNIETANNNVAIVSKTKIFELETFQHQIKALFYVKMKRIL